MKDKNNPIEASIKREASASNIGKVLMTLSGGADSIATAFALKNSGIEILALHCNFHLRGEESNRDMEFVKKFCTDNQISFEIKEFNVLDYLKENKHSSVEMACRDLRHDWFKKKLEETGYDRIVTGHNADDNIETFFLNLLRGSGTRGLKGMIKDNGLIWRPLLNFHRKEILKYIKDNDLNFVVDSTNLKNDYRRNYLRNTVIPLLKKEWKGFDSALDKTIHNLEKENQVIENNLNNILYEGIRFLSVETIENFPSPMLLIKRFIEPLGPFSTTPQEVLASIKANKPHIRIWRLKRGNLYLKNKKLFIEMSHSESCS